uniref:Uncharacterized protein n=1 Tax=Romanomermis culicivorax TaxID=13658 RepID=A0A915J5R3_ROMCU
MTPDQLYQYYIFFPSQSTTKALWLKLHKDEPNLVPYFESFLHSVSRQLKQSHQDVNALENAMQSRNSAHNSEIKRLYDEMELQLRTERQRVLQEEELKLQKLKDDMNREI